MPNIKPSEDFLPKQIKDLPLFKKSADIINDIRQENLNSVQDVLSKYKDFTLISNEATEEIIKEFGYKYIIDVLNLDAASQKVLLSYVSLIHFLKGHLNGLKIVLNFLNVTYTITEWFNQVPIGVPHTFKLDINLNVSNIGADVEARIRDFIKQYVYPKMDLTLNIDLEAQLETGMIGVFDFSITGTTVYPGTGHGFNFGQSFGDDAP